jgi:hypothetical protein
MVRLWYKKLLLGETLCGSARQISASQMGRKAMILVDDSRSARLFRGHGKSINIAYQYAEIAFVMRGSGVQFPPAAPVKLGIS